MTHPEVRKGGLGDAPTGPPPRTKPIVRSALDVARERYPTIAELLAVGDRSRAEMSRVGTPEGKVLRACMDYLALCGIAAWRINTMGTPLQGHPGRFRPAPSKGISDIIAIATVRGDGMQALPFAIEVKSERGRQSPSQVAFARKWEAAGGVYLIARSVPELSAKLREAGVATRVR
jgi:hypothetical protein